MSGKDDCISRRDAIEEISEHGTIWMSYTDDMSACEIAMEAISNAKDTMIRIIKGLPAVQPERSSEIQDILEYLDKVLHPVVSPNHWNVYSELHDMISMLPSAQPEQCEWIPKEVEGVPYGLIVECSKCKHSELIDNALYHKYCPNCGRKVIREYE